MESKNPTPENVYADLNAQPQFLNSGTTVADYQAASTVNAAHQCIQCFQCNQCHQCVASSGIECPEHKNSK